MTTKACTIIIGLAVILQSYLFVWDLQHSKPSQCFTSGFILTWGILVLMSWVRSWQRENKAKEEKKNEIKNFDKRV